ncbi:MAG: phosphoglucosamine mutase [bacterium]|nr:phosphoglucosamine mutase [bacterium]
MVSVSGVRGIVGVDLTPPVVVSWISGFAASLPKGATVVLGTDPRPTREPLRQLIFGTLTLAGCKVFDLGIASTPTVAIAVEELQAAGGIALTASHNPAQWNALKFFRNDGRFLLEEEGKELRRKVEAGEQRWVAWNEIGSVNTPSFDMVQRHIERVLTQTPGVDVDAIRRAKLTVACDGGGGVAGACIPQLLDTLGVVLSSGSLGMKADGDFYRKLEPTPDVLGPLGEEVLRSRSCIGFAFDPDGDRLACVSNDGTPVGEETTVTLTVDQVLRYQPGPVVVNISTTIAVDDIAKRYNVPVYRTKVGEANVADKMLAVKASCGGEGNGGVMIPACHPGRDSLVGIALLLTAIATRGSLDQLLKDVPRYTIVKKATEVDPELLVKHGGVPGMLNKLAEERPYENWDRTDGLKLTTADGWVQIRGSNTEPIFRIFAESSNTEIAEQMVNDMMHRFGRLL